MQKHEAKYDKETDTYLFPYEDGDNIEWDEYKGTVINTFEGPVKVYSIGSGFWVWDDLSTHNEHVNSGVLLQE